MKNRYNFMILLLAGIHLFIFSNKIRENNECSLVEDMIKQPWMKIVLKIFIRTDLKYEKAFFDKITERRIK